jgi:hypothetical protein
LQAAMFDILIDGRWSGRLIGKGRCIQDAKEQIDANKNQTKNQI